MNNFLDKVIVEESNYSEEWYDHFYKCKKCGVSFMFSSSSDLNPKPSFCPGCGRAITIFKKFN